MSPRYLLNQTVEQLTPSATLAINEQSQQLADSGAELFRLGFGQSPFPVPQSLVKALQDNAHQKAYLPAQGLLALRQAIGDYLLRTEQLNYQPEQILVGPGTKELMYLLQSVLQAELVLPSPSWVSYAPQAAILGREISWLPGNLADD
jgi:aspartate aminotransferase